MTEHSWPGNVRELENIVQRAVVLCTSAYVEPDDLDIKGRPADEPLFDDGQVLPLKQAMKLVERRLLVSGLQACNGNRKQTAERLRINRTTLYNKLHEHGLMDA